MISNEERIENIINLKSELQQILKIREHLNLAKIEVTLNVDLEYDFNMLDSRFDFRKKQLSYDYSSRIMQHSFRIMQASVNNRINDLNNGLIPLRNYLLDGDIDKNADYLDFINDCNKFLKILEEKTNNDEL